MLNWAVGTLLLYGAAEGCETRKQHEVDNSGRLIIQGGTDMALK